jgi:hypothetical protein
MPPGNLIMGIKYLDDNHMASTKFLGVYMENQLRAYHFYFEANGELFQELLPFLMLLVFQERTLGCFHRRSTML